MADKNAAGIRPPLSWGLLSFLVVFLPAISLRLIFLTTLDTPFLFFKYPYFAEKLAAGDSIGTRLADLSPFYLYFLTLFRWLTPFDWASLKVVQALVGALNCWLTAVLGKQVFDDRAIGIIAGLGLAGYGNLIVLETTLEPTVFVICFNLLAVLFLYRYVDSVKPPGQFQINRPLLLSALFTGAAIITKPSFLLFLPLAVIWLCTQPAAGRSLLRTVSVLTLFCAVALTIVFSISLRNYLLLDDAILVTADAGKVFFHGNSKEATVTQWAGLPAQGLIEDNSKEPDYAHTAFRQSASRQAGRELTPSEASRFWTRKTLDDIAADPVRYVRRQLEKFQFFFSGYELHYIASAYREYKTSLDLPFIRISWIIAPAVVGMLLAAGHFTRLLPIYGTVLLYLASGLIFIVQSRYRLPAVPFFCLFAAFAGRRCFQSIRTRRLLMPAVATVGAVAVGLFSNNLLAGDIQAIEKWYQATKIHYELDARVKFRKEDYPGAIAAASRALALAPTFAPAYNLRGKSHAVLAEHQAAIKDFTTMIRLNPESATGYRNLGFVLLINQDGRAAIPYLEKALALAPGDDKVKAALVKLRPGDSGGS